MLVTNILTKLQVISLLKAKENKDISFTIPSDKDWNDRLSGGAGDNKKPSQFDRQELIKGIKDELEHTDNINLALEIAMDHLTDDPEYYSNQTNN